MDDLVGNIKDSEIRRLVEVALQKAPAHFWTKPSSSTGKYHPSDEQCSGGLVLHTRRVCQAAEILMKAYPPPFHTDVIRAACILHDIARYGLNEVPSVHSLREHPELGAQFIGTLNTDCSPILARYIQDGVRRHMGKWGRDKPQTIEDWLVHLADMIASQYNP